MKLTLQKVREELAPLGITIRRTIDTEVVVRIKGSPKGQGYFTTELEDALGTGREMAKWQANSPTPIP